MYLYKLQSIYFHHHHEEYAVEANRFIKIISFTLDELKYRIRFIIQRILHELQRNKVCILCFQHDPNHYLISTIKLNGYSYSNGSYEWYNIILVIFTSFNM